MNKTQEIKAGISAYKYEQTVLLRLLRRYKRITSYEFDKLFRSRRSRILPRYGIAGDSFLLGFGGGGNDWSWWLDLMHHMMFLGMIDAVIEDDVIVYSYIKGLE